MQFCLRYHIPIDSLTFENILNGKRKEMNEFPINVRPTEWAGFELVAARDLQAGEKVALFQGPKVQYSECSDYDKRYVLIYLDQETKEWSYLLPLSDARFANHACEPNCALTNDLYMVTCKPVKKGEALTFLYNKGNENDEWDPIWNFNCACGSTQCQGMIDRYRPVEEPALPKGFGNKADSEKEE